MLKNQETKYWAIRTVLYRLQNDWDKFIEIGIFNALLPLFKTSLEVHENWTISLTTLIDKLIGELGTKKTFVGSVPNIFINFIFVYFATYNENIQGKIRFF